MKGIIQHAVGEAPLVVVPGEHLHKVAGYAGVVTVKIGRVTIVVEINRYQWAVIEGENAEFVLHRRCLHDAVDLIHSRGTGGREAEVHQRYVQGGNPDGQTVQAAL